MRAGGGGRGAGGGGLTAAPSPSLSPRAVGDRAKPGSSLWLTRRDSLNRRPSLGRRWVPAGHAPPPAATRPRSTIAIFVDTAVIGDADSTPCGDALPPPALRRRSSPSAPAPPGPAAGLAEEDGATGDAPPAAAPPPAAAIAARDGCPNAPGARPPPGDRGAGVRWPAPDKYSPPGPVVPGDRAPP